MIRMDAVQADRETEVGAEMQGKNDSTNHMIEALIAVETAMAGESGDGRARQQRLQEARMHLRSALRLSGGVPESTSAASNG